MSWYDRKCELNMSSLEEKRRELEAKKRELEEKRRLLEAQKKEVIMTPEEENMMKCAKERHKRIEKERVKPDKKVVVASGVDGKEIERSYYANIQHSEEYQPLFEKKIKEYASSSEGFVLGSNLAESHRKAIQKYLPEVDLNRVVCFYDQSKMFKPSWTVVTRDTIYDSKGAQLQLKNIVNARSDNNYVYVNYLDSKRESYSFRIKPYQMECIINASVDAYIDLRNVAVECENKNQLEKAFRIYLECSIYGTNIDAMNNVGIFYKAGRYVKRDDERAVYWYEQAAERGNYYSASNLVVIYMKEKDYEKAWHWAKVGVGYNGSNKKNILDNMGYMSRYGYGCKKDTSQAMKYYEESYHLGSDYAAFALGEIYTHVYYNYAKALDYYAEAVKRNYVRANTYIGNSFLYGRAVGQNKDQMMSYFKIGKDKNHSAAYYGLGDYYAMQMRFDEAETHFRKALELGSKSAYVELAEMYQDERNPKSDINEALYWLEKGEDAGYTGAMVNLGHMYRDGKGVVQSDAKALELYHKALDQNSSDAKVALAVMYAKGRGVSKDVQKADELFKDALRDCNMKAKLEMAKLTLSEDYECVDAKETLFELLKYPGTSAASEAKKVLIDTALQNKLDFTSLEKQRLSTICNELIEKKLLVAETRAHLSEVLDYPFVDVSMKNQSAVNVLVSEKKKRSLTDQFHFLMEQYLAYPYISNLCISLAEFFLMEENEETALALYRRAKECEDYRYNEEVEFNEAYLSMKLHHDFDQGKQMLDAISRGYKKGTEKFVRIVSKYYGKTKNYEYFHNAYEMAKCLGKPFENHQMLMKNRIESVYLQKIERLSEENVKKSYKQYLDCKNDPRYSWQASEAYDIYVDSMTHYLYPARYGHLSSIHKVIDFADKNKNYISHETYIDVYKKLNESFTKEGKLKIAEHYAEAGDVQQALKILREFIVPAAVKPEVAEKAYGLAQNYLKKAKKPVVLDSIYRNKLIKKLSAEKNLNTAVLVSKIADHGGDYCTQKVQVHVGFMKRHEFIDSRSAFAGKVAEIEKKYNVKVKMLGHQVVYLAKSSTYGSGASRYELIVEGQDAVGAASDVLSLLYLNFNKETVPEDQNKFTLVEAKCVMISCGMYRFITDDRFEEYTYVEDQVFDVPAGISEGKSAYLLINNDKVINVFTMMQDVNQDDYLYHQIKDRMQQSDKLLLEKECFELYSIKRYADTLSNAKSLVKWHNSAKACSLLGRMYLYGHGVEKNLEESAKWFAKAGEQNCFEDANQLLALLSQDASSNDLQRLYELHNTLRSSANKKTCYRVLEWMREHKVYYDYDEMNLWKIRLVELNDHTYESNLVNLFEDGDRVSYEYLRILTKNAENYDPLALMALTSIYLVILYDFYEFYDIYAMYYKRFSDLMFTWGKIKSIGVNHLYNLARTERNEAVQKSIDQFLLLTNTIRQEFFIVRNGKELFAHYDEIQNYVKYCEDNYFTSIWVEDTHGQYKLDEDSKNLPVLDGEKFELTFAGRFASLAYHYFKTIMADYIEPHMDSLFEKSKQDELELKKQEVEAKRAELEKRKRDLLTRQQQLKNNK